MISRFTQRETVPVACALIENGRAVLAAQRKYGDSQGGLWEFPGGKIRNGESPAAALAREIREELGVEIRIVRRLKRSVHVYRDRTIELIPFRCALVSGRPVAREHDKLKWVGPETARLLAWSPADIPILKRCLARFRSVRKKRPR